MKSMVLPSESTARSRYVYFPATRMLVSSTRHEPILRRNSRRIVASESEHIVVLRAKWWSGRVKAALGYHLLQVSVAE